MKHCLLRIKLAFRKLDLSLKCKKITASKSLASAWGSVLLNYFFAILIISNASTSYIASVGIQSAYVTFPAAFLFVLILLALRRSMLFDFELIILAFFLSIIYYVVHDGYFIFYNLIFIFALFFSHRYILEAYAALKKLTIFLLLLSFISFVGYLLNFFSPTEVLIGNRIMYLHGFVLTDYQSLDLDSAGSFRFYGFSDEPGAIAAIILLFLINEKFVFRGNKFFIVAGMATFSTSFFGIFLLYFLYYKWRRIFKFMLPAILIIPVLLAQFGESLVLEYFYIKLFYIFSDDFNYDPRLDSSLFYLLEIDFMIALIYVASIFLLPKRFWLFFVLLAFYRVHFIFNTVPLVLFLVYLHRLRAPNFSNYTRLLKIGLSKPLIN